MKLKFRDDKTGGDLLLYKSEEGFDRLFFSQDRFNKYFTIAWNPGPTQTVTIDGTVYDFPSQAWSRCFSINLLVLKSHEI